MDFSDFACVKKYPQGSATLQSTHAIIGMQAVSRILQCPAN